MISIIDLKIGNINSVGNAFKFLGFEYILTSNPKEVKQSDKIVLPGVGSFYEGSKRLYESGLADCIIDGAAIGKPILGICLGMQLLGTNGEEGKTISKGLGLIDASVRKLSCDITKFRLPHIGWNDISTNQVRFLKNVKNNSCFYFVHSYSMILNEKCDFATSNYGVEFVAAIQKKNICGTQFHPEKSRSQGLEILKTFGSWQIC